MKKLIFLYNSDSSKITWLNMDAKGKVIKGDMSKSFDSLQQEDFSEIKGVVASSEIKTKILDVPPASRQEIIKSIPYLLEDSLLDPLEDYHQVVSKRDSNGKVSISLIPNPVLEMLNKEIRNQDFIVKSLGDIANAFNLPKKTCHLAILKDISILNFDSKWGLCSDLDTILNLLQVGLTKYKCDYLEVYLIKSNRKIEFLDYSNLTPSIHMVDNDLDYFRQAIKFIDPKLNLLTARFAPRIPWESMIRTWRYVFASIALIIFLYFAQLVVEIIQNTTAANSLEKESKNIFYSSFPDTSKTVDLGKLLKRRLEGISISTSEPFLETLSNVSQVIINNKRTSLYSVTFDENREQFILEIQTSQFEDLETIQSQFKQIGYKVEIGASNRVGNLVLSEVYLNKS